MTALLLAAITELRYASRGLAQRPGYAGVAAFTLALGIGSSAAIFTVLNAVVLRPLPYPDADRIVEIVHYAPALNLPEVRSSPGLTARYRNHARAFAHVAAYEGRQLNVTGPGSAERVRAVATTPEIVDVLATGPAMGRAFTEADTATNAPLVAILSHTMWRSRFGADLRVVGRTIDLDGRAAEIIGVMAEGFAFPDSDTRLYVPLRLDPGAFGTLGMTAVARLAPQIGIDTARREIELLQQRIPEWFPGMTPELLARFGWSSGVQPWKERVVGSVSRTLWILFGTVGLVLVVAAANVANLFLVRAESRQREVAVKTALGASRRRIAGSFLAESLVLASIGGAAGLLVAEVGTRLLVAFGPPRLPRLHEVRLDAAVVAFTIALSTVAAAVLALLPALSMAHRSLNTLLRDGGRGSTAGRARQQARQLLIVTQVAMALVLLVGAGLMLKSIVRLNAVDPGFQVDGLITATLSVGAGHDRAKTIARYHRMLDEIAKTPGVASVGAAGILPLAATSMSGAGFSIRSRPTSERERPLVSMYTAVSVGYFETLGVPLLTGRPPEDADEDQKRAVAWVSKEFARQFLGDQALGEWISIEERWLEIAGVVGDIRTSGVRDAVRPMIYLPLSNPAVKLDVMHAVVRTATAPVAAAPAIRAAIERVDASVPVTTRTIADIMAASLAQTTFTVTLLGLAAAIGLVLGLVGLYGATSYIAVQRTTEIAVRLALGAKPLQVCLMVLRQGAVVAAVGISIGLIVAWASARFMTSMLFEVSERDPATYAAVAMLLMSVSLLAAYLPARRAAATDPIQALRSE